MANVLTLFQRDYRLGAGALVNSLSHQGFSGRIFALTDRTTSFDQQLADQARSVGIQLILEENSDAEHFAFLKPKQALQVLSRLEPFENLVYFDPDIVLTAPYSFVDEWSRRGVALVEEMQFYRMSCDHPIRLYWIDWLTQRHRLPSRRVGMYFNSGFFSANASNQAWLADWSWVLDQLQACGDVGPGVDRNRHRPFATWDQDAMNAALMLSDTPLSTMGPDAMGFTGTSIIMLHATGSAKPWRKRFVREALRGVPPTLADKGWLANTRGPIEVLSPGEFRKKSREIRLASALGRFIRRA